MKFEIIGDIIGVSYIYIYSLINQFALYLYKYKKSNKDILDIECPEDD